MVNHKNKTLADKITVIGEAEHLYYHAKKAASTLELQSGETEGDMAATGEVFYQTLSQMVKNFRREYMRKHFPDCPEELWCVVKATEALRQRVYEADEGETDDLTAVDAIWTEVMNYLTGEDLSGCIACKEDREEDNAVD